MTRHKSVEGISLDEAFGSKPHATGQYPAELTTEEFRRREAERETVARRNRLLQLMGGNVTKDMKGNNDVPADRP